MNVIGVILMSMLTHGAYKGSKVLIALYALEFGACVDHRRYYRNRAGAD